MNTKKLTMAVVTAITVLVGGLGAVLWPSSAEVASPNAIIQPSAEVSASGNYKVVYYLNFTV